MLDLSQISDAALYVLGGIITVVGGVITGIAKAYKDNLEKHFDDSISELNDRIDELGDFKEKYHDIEKKILEYQIAASATFVLKDDFRDFKIEVNKRLGHSNENIVS